MAKASIAKTTALSRQSAKSDRPFDEEASESFKLSHKSHAPLGETLRRRSTINAILDALNKAHIKDFQRKTYSVPIDDSDEEEEDEEDGRKVGPSRGQNKQLP